MARIFEIGSFRLDAATGAVTRDGKPMPLGPRAVAVLATLVEHVNEFVTNAQIIDAAWPGVVVEEGNLAVDVWAAGRFDRGIAASRALSASLVTGPTNR